MKPTKTMAHALSVIAFAGASLQAQTVEIDPVDSLTNTVTIGSWNTDGDQENWTTQQLTPTIEGGLLKATAEGGDPFLFLNPLAPTIPTGKPSLVIVEFKLQRSATDTSGIQVFWDDSTAGGFAGARTLTLPGVDVPTDGLPHVYRFNLNNVNTSLIGLRIDPSTTATSELEFDYVNAQVNSGAPIIDPTDLINKYTSLGEWNTPDDFEGWTTNVLVTSPVVGSGLLSGTSSGNDPQVALAGLTLDTDNGENQIIEMRIRRQSNDTGRIDLFWADASGGFGGPRRAIIPANTWPTDGEFHIVQFPLGEFITGDLASLRFDPVADNLTAVTFDLDYVRIGIIDADDDNDGLANSVETGTGIFVSAENTGTDPNDDDTDNDTFLDGNEVAFGTDPNDVNDFPTPTLVTYSGSPASYIVDILSTPNSPTIANGTPTGFTIAPTLPAGLSIDSGTGIITGTATAATTSAVYTITATFAGAITSTYDLTLEVLNPGITGYTANNIGYDLNLEIPLNSPTTFGAAPTSYSIIPALPEGLTFITSGGQITGAPTTVSPLTEYTVTANYGGSYPNATYTLNIQVKASAAFIGADNQPLGIYVSLAEWETNGDLEGWGVNNANGSVAGGILTSAATGGDPQLFKAGTVDTSQGEIIEIRARQNAGGLIQLFWADASGGFGGGRSFTIDAASTIPDGEYHTYQIDMTGVFVGAVSNIRFDLGNTNGHTVDVDYIRIGSATPPADPVISAFSYDPIFDEITITWSSVSGETYRLEGSDDLNNWVEVADSLDGDNGSTSSIIPVPNTLNFFRIVLED